MKNYQALLILNQNNYRDSSNLIRDIEINGSFQSMKLDNRALLLNLIWSYFCLCYLSIWLNSLRAKSEYKRWLIWPAVIELFCLVVPAALDHSPALSFFSTSSLFDLAPCLDVWGNLPSLRHGGNEGVDLLLLWLLLLLGDAVGVAQVRWGVRDDLQVVEGFVGGLFGHVAHELLFGNASFFLLELRCHFG